MTPRAHSSSTSGQRPVGGAIRGAILPVLVLSVFCAGQIAWQLARNHADAPSSAQRIYAALVEWGADASDLLPPVDEPEIDRRMALLWSDDSEERVRAAHWLAARGIRRAGGQIAASMADPGTQRPCQLAHSLGKLGDDQWVDELLVAAKQPYNTDLRTCATIALKDIASVKAVGALIELVRGDPSRLLAVQALGQMGDPRALEQLRSLRSRATSEGQHRTANLAIERIELLLKPDPIPELFRRIEDSAAGGSIDEWALRQVVRRGDARCAESIARLFVVPGYSRRTRELLAAALLSCGNDGRDALARAMRDGRDEAREIASIALSLRRQNGNEIGLVGQRQPRIAHLFIR